jgi:predicted AlkP superfamily phosphohydrolase/phosphomutase
MKTILVGFDAFDPLIFEKLHSEGKTPNLSKLVETGGYARFTVSDPPQSEVSWTSIATGLNPGGHGIFDFVHRNPETYSRHVSLLPTKNGFLGRQFIQPHNSSTIFDAAVEDGYPGISLWWPATFPAEQSSPVNTIPGLGTPDIFGRLGVGIYYAIEDLANGDLKTRFGSLLPEKGKVYSGIIEGPRQRTFSGIRDSQVKFLIEIIDGQFGKLIINEKSYELHPGEWSPIIELTFKVGFGISIKAVTRVLFSLHSKEPALYFLPLQLHPLKSPWPYGTPKRFMKEVWKNPGPYLTLGWPQDTTGLEEGFINTDHFLDLCTQIFEHREKTLLNMIDIYEEGVLACVFDSLDRIQHMYLKDRFDVVEEWYLRLDTLFGRIQEKIQVRNDYADIHLMVVSDHGFGPFWYKVHLNRWLIEQGFLTTKGPTDVEDLNSVDWIKSQAYAIGLNSIYINLKGREKEGIVDLTEKDNYVQSLCAFLEDWEGPDGTKIVSSAKPNSEVFKGPYSEFAPDILVGYSPGFRGSAKTGMGEWGGATLEQNKDHWSSDHCFCAESVPGVLFSNQNLINFVKPSYRDIPMLVLNKEIAHIGSITPPAFSDEDQDKVNERLKELGYL